MNRVFSFSFRQARSISKNNGWGRDAIKEPEDLSLNTGNNMHQVSSRKEEVVSL